ncbi:MAG: succinyldiaminopimelate transaminase [Pseudomonadota bacterium]
MNPRLSALQAYPFERLHMLTTTLTPNPDKDLIKLTVGEPKHDPAQVVIETLRKHAHTAVGRYPSTRGMDALREQISEWLACRFKVKVDPDNQVLPVNGTREGLFAIAQTMIDTSKPSAQVLLPNPFYQIYEGAALLAGATPCYLPATAANAYLPALDEIPSQTLDACELFYVCTPGNPHGNCCSLEYLKTLINLAQRHNFTIVSDECYSEVYRRQPPSSLLEACHAMGNDEYEHCLVFHSLSKRSNLPGLRSGFVAGNAELIGKFLKYRTYHGSAMSELVQLASIGAWADEAHVNDNRALYNAKYESVARILAGQLALAIPEGGFYLWLNIDGDSEEFCAGLYRDQHLLALPGTYLSREIQGSQPGFDHIRLSLVDTPEVCDEAAKRLSEYLQTV